MYSLRLTKVPVLANVRGGPLKPELHPMAAISTYWELFAL